MGTSSYEGPAMVLAGGLEIRVHAELTAETPRHGQTGWRGTLQAEEAGEDFESMHESHSGRLRLYDGREGAFTVTRAVQGFGRTTLRITGSGSIPF
ncbi:DUF4873 domain-containing protein [Kitasatospora mediocidica]|uniref:DUF4873 domain-containing protein n=1 Tax=Kitasatospora mediocidica TaxID=58352 RepID=UPI0012FAC114|nr:DUF4873 domain-containing protein [Kitasatospora mediocidica]